MDIEFSCEHLSAGMSVEATLNSVQNLFGWLADSHMVRQGTQVRA